MMIKCPKCGFENQLGAIFCRSCGEKLNIEEVRPKLIDQGGGFSIFKIIYKLIVLVLFLGLVGVIIAMFIPADQSAYLTLTDSTEQQAAKAKLNKILERINEGYGNTKYVISPAEATFIYNSSFIEKLEGDAGGAYAVEKIAFRIDERGFVNILLQTKLAGKISTTFELKGAILNPSEGEEGKIKFIVSECSMGRMPIKFLEKVIIEKFMPSLYGQPTKILEGTKAIEVDDDKNFVLILK